MSSHFLSRPHTKCRHRGSIGCVPESTGKLCPSTHLPDPARFRAFCIFRCGARIDDFHVVTHCNATFISSYDKVKRPSATLFPYVRPHGPGAIGRHVIGDQGPRVSTVRNHLYRLSAYFHCNLPCSDLSPATLRASASQPLYSISSPGPKVHIDIVS